MTLLSDMTLVCMMGDARVTGDAHFVDTPGLTHLKSCIPNFYVDLPLYIAVVFSLHLYQEYLIQNQKVLQKITFVNF